MLRLDTLPRKAPNKNITDKVTAWTDEMKINWKDIKKGKIEGAEHATE